MFLYPEPSQLELHIGRYTIKQNLKVNADFLPINIIRLFKKRIMERYGICVREAKAESCDILFKQIVGQKEYYQIHVTEEKIELGAADYKGFVHAIETLLQIGGDDMSIPCMTLQDAPYKRYRGVHILMPAPEYLEECKRFFDVLSFLKYNTIIMEVGGTMELKRHPEVNRAWVEFCETVVKKFPGGPQNFQWSDRYWKDSTHFENARGKILKQEEVRDLVQYAKNLGFTVIPEIQALSHCYYLTMAHREIAEDANDLFPDTFCPLNEESYKLYFDVAEEMIEVIEPEIVSIGHDEIRILGECPKCREKSGHELLAYEINRLHQFYAQKNIRIMMWCETMLQPEPKYGIKRGLETVDRVDAYGRHYHLPTMYKALEELPKDIIMLDWYHSRSHNTEECFTDRGFEVMFGNFNGIDFGNWDVRSERVLGAEHSTWCTPDEFTLGRNGSLFDLTFSAQFFWKKGYCDSKYSEYLSEARNAVEQVRKIMRAEYAEDKQGDRGLEILFAGENGLYDVRSEDAVCHGSKAKGMLEKCPKMSGVPLDTAHVMLRTDIYADSLILCEAFKKPEVQYMSYSFINTPHWDESPMSDSGYLCTNMPRWSAATHEVLYEDGTWELINATYGITAADVHMEYDREKLYLDERVNEIDDDPEKGTERKPAPHYKLKDKWMSSVLYFADTIVCGDTTAYVYEWKNPHPEKKIVCIKCVNTTHDKEQSVVLFALGYERRL